MCVETFFAVYVLNIVLLVYLLCILVNRKTVRVKQASPYIPILIAEEQRNKIKIKVQN